VPDSAFEQGEIPDELLFRGFRGWRNRRTGERGLSPAEKQALWLLRHPRYAVATRPDLFFESALTGPLPGKNLPIIGSLIDRTTFLFGFKYENTQFAFPLGPRDSYEDWNVQLKLTTRPTPSTKLVLTGMYALIQTINEGRTSDYGGALVDRTNWEVSGSYVFLNADFLMHRLPLSPINWALLCSPVAPVPWILHIPGCFKSAPTLRIS